MSKTTIVMKRDVWVRWRRNSWKKRRERLQTEERMVVSRRGSIWRQGRGVDVWRQKVECLEVGRGEFGDWRRERVFGEV